MITKRMGVDEFVSRGYLQEVNRRFFHPLGLALEVAVPDDGPSYISSIWDNRDDLEGIYFYETDPEKALFVDEEWEKRLSARMNGLGYMVQPIGVAGVEK